MHKNIQIYQYSRHKYHQTSSTNIKTSSTNHTSDSYLYLKDHQSENPMFPAKFHRQSRHHVPPHHNARQRPPHRLARHHNRHLVATVGPVLSLLLGIRKKPYIPLEYTGYRKCYLVLLLFFANSGSVLGKEHERTGTYYIKSRPSEWMCDDFWLR